MDSAANKPVYTKTNEETQMQARVFAASKGGFTVTLFDIESGNAVPHMMTKTTLQDAVELAHLLVSDDASSSVLVRF